MVLSNRYRNRTIVLKSGRFDYDMRMELRQTTTLIAISPQIADDGSLMVLPEYPAALEQWGAASVLIAPGDANEHSAQTLDAAAHARIEDLLPPHTAGILIPGGDDIDPRLYHQKPCAATQPPHPLRDTWEPRLIAYALEHEIPLLGICRGMQMMNVVQGGTLIQTLEGRHNLEAHRARPGHTATLLPRTVLNPGEQPAIIGVNSLHNQAIDRLGTDVLSCAVAEDNIIEALCIRSTSFALGVQWHPELMEDKQAQRTVFEPFVEACKCTCTLESRTEQHNR